MCVQLLSILMQPQQSASTSWRTKELHHHFIPAVLFLVTDSRILTINNDGCTLNTLGQEKHAHNAMLSITPERCHDSPSLCESLSSLLGPMHMHCALRQQPVVVSRAIPCFFRCHVGAFLADTQNTALGPISQSYNYAILQ